MGISPRTFPSSRSNAYLRPLAKNACSSRRSAQGPRNGMPLIAGRALNSSIERYGQYRMFCPFTLISNAMLPTDGRIETMVCFVASSRRTTSPLRCDEYRGATAKGVFAAIRATRIAATRFIGRSLNSIQSECIQHVAAGDEDMLLAVEHIRLRRIRDGAQPRVPQRRSGGGVESHEVARAVARKEQTAGSRQHAGGTAAARQCMTPRDPSGFRIEGRDEVSVVAEAR